MPEPLTPEQFRKEVADYQTRQMEASLERVDDIRDRMRETRSWPEEVKNARWRVKSDR